MNFGQPISGEEALQLLDTGPRDPFCDAIVATFLNQADRTSFHRFSSSLAANVQGEDGLSMILVLPNQRREFHLELYDRPVTHLVSANKSKLAHFGHPHRQMTGRSYAGQADLSVDIYSSEFPERMAAIAKEITFQAGKGRTQFG